MADDVPDALKRERLERVQELQRQLTAERYGAMLGQRVAAIVDRPGGPGRKTQARTTAQADDIDGVTWVDTDAPPGTIVEVELHDVVDDYDFQGAVTRTLAPVSAPRAVGRSLPVVGLGADAAFGRPSPA
jgi:ribosomal protein S12 methylthiotransferase